MKNLKRSKCHNHNMSRFEITEFLDSEFTRVIIQISYCLILIEFCRNKQIEIHSLFYNDEKDIVLVGGTDVSLMHDIKRMIQKGLLYG